VAIPDYQSIMLPLLKVVKDNRELTLREAIGLLAEKLQISDEDRKTLLPSGRQTTFANRVGWAGTYLKKAGLLQYPRRGALQITERGETVLSQNPPVINVKFLEQYEEFNEFKNLRREDEKPVNTPDTTQQVGTPEETFESAYQKLRQDLAGDLLRAIKGCSPEFFERLVLDVLVAMGYGGTRADAAQAVGRSGDGGIDGIIKEDRLGLDIIYIQAKRWEGVVGRPEIQKFAGALQMHRAKKGVFITTSAFTRDATDYVSRIDSKIVLLDGQALADLMIDCGVGVTSIATYQVKKVDGDYFVEE
jgi:restriction system protein